MFPLPSVTALSLPACHCSSRPTSAGHQPTSAVPRSVTENGEGEGVERIGDHSTQHALQALMPRTAVTHHDL